jgi:hypothetical protein
MATILNYTDFVAPYSIPDGGDNTYIEQLNSWLPVWQADYLIKCLGYRTYKSLIANLELPSPAQKWLNLLNGAEYVDESGSLQYYEGLKKMLLNFSYALFCREFETYVTPTGEKIGKQQNSDTSLMPKFFRFYNYGVDIYTNTKDFCAYWSDEFPDFEQEKMNYSNQYGI